MKCSTCSRPIQRDQISTTWWEEKNGKQLYRVAHVECPAREGNARRGADLSDFQMGEMIT